MACDTVGTWLYQQKYSLGLSSSGGKMNRLTACFSLGRLEVFGSVQDTKRQIFALFRTQSRLMRWRCGVGEVTGDWRFWTTCQSKGQRSEAALQNMMFPGSVFARCIDPRVGLDYSEMTCYSGLVSAPGQLVFVRVYYNVFIFQYWHTFYPSSCKKDTNAQQKHCENGLYDFSLHFRL